MNVAPMWKQSSWLWGVSLRQSCCHYLLLLLRRTSGSEETLVSLEEAVSSSALWSWSATVCTNLENMSNPQLELAPKIAEPWCLQPGLTSSSWIPAKHWHQGGMSQSILLKMNFKLVFCVSQLSHHHDNRCCVHTLSAGWGKQKNTPEEIKSRNWADQLSNGSGWNSYTMLEINQMQDTNTNMELDTNSLSPVRHNVLLVF